MATTLKQTEETPAAYPEISGDLIREGMTAAQIAALPADYGHWIWARVESYIAYRFTARSVVWIVEDAGDWVPPLTPATISTVEVWEASTWTETVPPESPYGGYCLPGDGPYRITASVGGGDVPALVAKAVQRLANYCVSAQNEETGPALWATAMSHSGSGEHASEFSVQRQASWIAKALQNSGAADLLRNYRRAQ